MMHLRAFLILPAHEEVFPVKKFLPYANYLAASAGVAGALLHRWYLSAGPDSSGLYPAAHPGTIGYVLVILAAGVALFLMTQDCGKNGSWRPNFPGGLLPAIGQLLAAAGLLIYGIPKLELFWSVNAVSAALAVCSALALVIVTVLQHQKQDGFGILYLLPCLFFALQLFLVGKTSSTETQLPLYLPQVLACAFSALACYEIIGFGAGIGNRRKSLFWSLSAAMLCIAAGAAHWYFLPLGLWQLASHCTLSTPPEETPEEEPDPATETPEE
jgi:hypothetical protein